ncbi:actin-related protein [Blastocystis sp. subtype 4]|uniref:actin-related protein n=1 Tax=Blastocystis sp. subtype 4 TaxID=944170 RepID=UPI0007120273|nr:actin-related protein [Blastocystis sp. subtype 4]KNB45486.1 actin-related protein [Blastocystis sp. subtype 4]|eukprot:XP_014528939.1 actin-related protein [Blastocystis sp. subtype 4]
MSVVPNIHFDYTTEVQVFIVYKSNVIIIDIGTYESRFGFAGDESSQLSLPSNIVNYQKPSGKRSSPESQTAVIVGESKPWRFHWVTEYMYRYKDVEVTPLVKDFNIRSWEGVERMIFHAMEDWLCVKTDDNPVLVVEPPFAKRSRREKFAELLFEKFKVPGLMMYKDAALTCFSRGRTMGMVVDLGEELIRCCGVIDGFVSRENVSFQRFGGARLRDLYIDKCLAPFLESQKEEKARSIFPRGIVGILRSDDN